MARQRARGIILTDKEKEALEKIRSSGRIEHRYHQRALIILKAAAGETNYAMAKTLNIMRNTIKQWRKRWLDNKEELERLSLEKDNKKYRIGILEILRDKDRSGHPIKFTAEQVCQIMSVACEKPQDSGHILSHWGAKQLAMEVEKRGIVESISKTQVGRFLKSGGY